MQKKIKSYTIDKQIGTGGFGEVYVAKQDVINRDVAIKVILPLYANRADFIQRFQQEAELVAKLEHPHIVPLYDYWRDPDGAFLVMRYINGGNLADKITSIGALDVATASRLLEQIAGALHTAHRNRIIHQDIKPANILLDNDGNAYLTDFGIARDIEGNINLAEDASNTMHGSPKYISPEHLRRREITSRSDIYSLGILMYEVLTGHPPFEHDDMLQLLQMHVRRDLPPLQDKNPSLPDSLNYPLKQATLKDPLARYDSVLQFAQDFQASVSNLNPDRTSPIPMPSSNPIEVTGVIDIRNPYKGLKAFQESDAEDFYGRDALVKSLMKRMTETGRLGRFLAVVGASGSGKSSVVRAGLIPEIRKGSIMGLPQLFISTMIPGSDPMRGLEGAILNIASRATIKIMQTISGDEYDLNEVLSNALPENGEMLLLVDQFEELFTLIPNEAKRRNFLNIIYKALTATDSRLRLIVTLRADFLDRPLQYPDWGELFRERTELVPAMSESELRDVIEKPAEKNGLILVEGLSDVIIRDMNNQVGILPLLQYTLSELYERRKGLELRVVAYENMGGISGALAKRANEIYNTLSTEQKDVAKLLFTRLVRIGNRGENTRQRVLLGEIYSLERDYDAIQSTVDIFGKYRLLTFDNDSNTRLPTVEITHEALIRSWGQLHKWIEDNEDALRLQERLSAEARQWQDEDKDKSYLATGMRLEQFETLDNNDIIALTKREQEYLNASIQLDEARKLAKKRRQKVTQAFIATIALAGVIAIIFGFIANNQRRLAEEARDAEAQALVLEEIARQQADENARQSRARELAASSLLFAETFPDRALLLSLESLAIENTFEGRNALLTGLLTQSGLVGYFNGHDDFVRTVVSSNNGAMIATASRDGQVIIWDANTRLPLIDLVAHESRVNNLAFSSDDSRLASVDGVGRLIIWDIETGDIIQELGINEQEIRDVAFSPDNSLIASAHSSGQVVWWSAEDYSQLAISEAHEGGVIYALEFSPDSQTLATGGADNSIHLWATNTLSIRQVIPAHNDWVLSLAFSPDGQQLASGGVDAIVRVWSVADGTNTLAFSGHRNEIYALTYSDDGQLLISGGLDANIILWDMQQGEFLSAFVTFARTGVRSLADFNNTLYIAGETNEVIAVNIGFIPRFGTSLATTSEEILTTAISQNDAIAYAGGTENDFNIYLLDDDNTEPLALAHHEGLVTDLAWQNERLISVSVDRTVAIWEDGILAHDFMLNDSILSVASYDNLLAFGMNNGNIRLWDTTNSDYDDWSEITILDRHTGRINDLSFNSDGTELASVSRDNTLIIWDMATFEARFEPLEGHTGAGIETARFHPIDPLIATGGRDTNIILWNTETGEQLGPALVNHDNWVNDIAFSPDGQLMFSVSGDQSVIIWSVAEQRAIGLPFIGHANWINSISASADNRSIITGGRDGMLMRWDIDLTEWIDTACSIVNRNLTDGEIRDFFNVIYPPTNTCSQN